MGSATILARFDSQGRSSLRASWTSGLFLFAKRMIRFCLVDTVTRLFSLIWGDFSNGDGKKAYKIVIYGLWDV